MENRCVSITIDGNNRERAFKILGTGTLTLNNITLTATRPSGQGGGAILNQGVLILNDRIISDSATAEPFHPGGGAIFNAGQYRDLYMDT